jgi:hypothetical protein
MARKKAGAKASGDEAIDRDTASSPTRLTLDTKRSVTPTFPTLEGRPLPTVHVNNANLTELKNACDDAVKKVGPRGG